jgi:hypothetical protein
LQAEMATPTQFKGRLNELLSQVLVLSLMGNGRDYILSKLKPTKRCPHCIVGLLFSTYSSLESYELATDIMG